MSSPINTDDLLQTTALIMAGGMSSRMGHDKALITLDGETLIERAARRASKVFAKVIVSGPDEHEVPGFTLIKDEFINMGPMAGLLAGLSASETDWIFALPCDSPFVPQAFLRGMNTLAKDCDVVVPRPGEFYEPLHALYSKKTAPVMRELLEKGRRRIIELYGLVKTNEVSPRIYSAWDPAEMAFFNINLPEDLEEAEKLIKQKRGKL
jgi:molybdopterin-guanine dinucleotide biosynthesis protein A